MEQDIRFCALGDGAKIAYSTTGHGPSLVFVPRWVSHLELNWQSRRGLLTPVAEHFRLVRYDKRGTGLSDRPLEDFSIDGQLRDLTALIEELGLGRFSLYASSGGGPIAVSYAALHPERVENLVLYGSFARLDGVTGRRQTSEALVSLMRAEWGLASTALTDVFMPGASSEEREDFALTQRLSAESEIAARFWEAFVLADVRALLPRVQARTLVVHSKGDRAIPLQCGWELATAIRGAQFVTLESDRHILSPELERQLWTAVLDFLSEKGEGSRDRITAHERMRPANPAGLSDREVEVLRLIAEGKTNQQIADQLVISLNTVAHHVSNIFAKAGLGNRAQAASYAHLHHLM